MDEKLRKFLKVVELGSFTKAAQQLHVSQPAITMAVKDLERELDVQLFIRQGNRIRCTDEARLITDKARAIAGTMHDLRTELTELRGSLAPISVGMIDSIAEQIFRRPDMQEMVQSNTSHSITVDSSSRLAEAVVLGKLDGAFIAQSESSNNATLTVSQLGDECLVAVIASTAKKSLNQTAPLPYISYNEASATAQLVSSALRKREISFRPVLYSTSPEVMLKLCLRGVGFAVLPDWQVAPYLKDESLSCLLSSKKASNVLRPVQYVRRAGSFEPRGLRVFADTVEGLLANNEK